MPRFNLTVRRVWHETFELEVEAATPDALPHGFEESPALLSDSWNWHWMVRVSAAID